MFVKNSFPDMLFKKLANAKKKAGNVGEHRCMMKFALSSTFYRWTHSDAIYTNNESLVSWVMT